MKDIGREQTEMREFTLMESSHQTWGIAVKQWHHWGCGLPRVTPSREVTP